MNQALQPLRIYRQFFKATQDCTDRSLKLYIRRRIGEEYRKNIKV